MTDVPLAILAFAVILATTAGGLLVTVIAGRRHVQVDVQLRLETDTLYVPLRAEIEFKKPAPVPVIVDVQPTVNAPVEDKRALAARIYEQWPTDRALTTRKLAEILQCSVSVAHTYLLALKGQDNEPALTTPEP